MQQKREIGRSGIRIAPLVLGGNVFGWNADQATSSAVLDAFVDRGGDAIDTADVYSAWAAGHKGGESENVIGAWLKQSGKRNKVVICTKVGMLPTRLGIKRQNIIDACEDSLKRMGIDTIDLYWLHRDDEAPDADEFTGALDALLKAGKIRSFGASNFKPARFAEALVAAKKAGVRYDAQQARIQFAEPWDRSGACAHVRARRCFDPAILQLGQRLSHYHMNESLWNTVLVENSDLSVKEIKWMIAHSYAEVVKKLTKKLQAELDSID